MRKSCLATFTVQLLLFASCASVKENEAVAKKDIYLDIVSHLEKTYPNDTISFFKNALDSKYYYRTSYQTQELPLDKDTLLINRMKEQKIWFIDAVPRDKVVLELSSSPFSQKHRLVSYYYKTPKVTPAGTAIAPNLYYTEGKGDNTQ